MSEQEPTITVSVSRKIGLPNYGSADAFVSVSGIKAGATEAEIKELMDTGKLAWSVLTAALKEKVDATLSEYGGK